MSGVSEAACDCGLYQVYGDRRPWGVEHTSKCRFVSDVRERANPQGMFVTRADTGEILRLLSENEQLKQALDVERDRVRVLAAAVPDSPWDDYNWCLSCGIDRDESAGAHRDDCPWLAAHAIKEALSHE